MDDKHGPLKKNLERKTLAFERNFYMKILGIRWVEMVTNEELYQIIQPKVTIMQNVIQKNCLLDTSVE